MRLLPWLAKGDRPEPKPCEICHPAHPKRALLNLVTPAHAHQYAADIIIAQIGEIRRCLELGSEPLQFVPVPSSDVTGANKRAVRWSGRDIGKRLAAAGLGTMVLAVVNKQPLLQKTKGGNYSYSDLLANYAREEPLAPNARVIYLDDILTHGHHMAAVDARLGKPSCASAIVIASTDSAPHDAYAMRVRELQRDGEDIDII